ncbi:MAG: hypothetical protein AMXMBFR44_3320 [Candidatus Campbellbacteria bacterium]
MKRAFRLFAVLLLLPLSAFAQSLLVCAADTHIARKGDFLNGTTSVVDQGVWEWEIDSGNTYSNIQGVSAHGMLYATNSLSDPIYALSVFSTANLLVGRYNANPTTRPYAQDVDFLWDVCLFDPAAYGMTVELFEGMEGNDGYCTMATGYYARLIGQFPNPYDNVDRHLTAGRGSLSGWDLSAHIRASWRSGFVSYAQGMVERILERRPDWEHVLLGGYDYTESSHGALARVIGEMHATGDVNEDAYQESLDLVDLLLAAQAPDGSWGQSDYQSTAYVLLGLRSDEGGYTASAARRTAIIAGENFLQDSATSSPSCGWSHPPEYGEMNSEVIMALSLINSLPFLDGFESEDTSAWTAAAE